MDLLHAPEGVRTSGWDTAPGPAWTWQPMQVSATSTRPKHGTRKEHRYFITISSVQEVKGFRCNTRENLAFQQPIPMSTNYWDQKCMLAFLQYYFTIFYKIRNCWWSIPGTLVTEGMAVDSKTGRPRLSAVHTLVKCVAVSPNTYLLRVKRPDGRR